jgi:hypothetical protein
MVAPVLIGAALEIAKIAAPWFARRLGGEKAGEVAEKVVGVAQQITGTGTPQEALAQLRADPNLVLRMQTHLAELDADLEKAYLADRQDARSMAVQMAQLGVGQERKNVMVAIDAIGLALSLGAMLTLGYVRAVYPASLSEGVFGALLAQLSMITSYFGLCLRDAHQFEFGSSRGSKDKDMLLAKETARHGGTTNT